MNNESVEENHNSTEQEPAADKQEDPKRNRMVPDQRQSLYQQTKNQENA